jgi:hypothetical protein
MSALGLSVFKKEKFSAEVKEAGRNVRKRIMITLPCHLIVHHQYSALSRCPHE